jgi:hypothetical protein
MFGRIRKVNLVLYASSETYAQRDFCVIISKTLRLHGKSVLDMCNVSLILSLRRFWSVRYFCPILTKTGTSRIKGLQYQILWKIVAAFLGVFHSEIREVGLSMAKASKRRKE